MTYTWYDSGSGNYRIRYKRSTVEGAVWGSGPSDAGTDLTSGSVAAYSQLQYAAPYLYCIYTDASSKLAIRELIDGGLVWGSEETAYTGILLSDRFSAAISQGGSLLGIAFEAVGKLFYLDYDGQTWSGVHELAVSPATPPLLQFSGSDPYVIYGVSPGSSQTAVVWRRKQGAGFAAEEGVGGEVATFLDVVLYDDDAPMQFVSRKDQAADSTAADVSHSTSGALIAAANDAVYFGASQPFATITCVLATAGVGGQVAWEYFDGSAWQEFTPASGAYHFDQLNQVVRLWTDSAAAPVGWQPTQIGSATAHWVRARVTTAYSTAPVGSQLTPLTDLKYLTI